MGKKQSGPKPFGDKVSLDLDYHMSAMEEGKKLMQHFFLQNCQKMKMKFYQDGLDSIYS